MRLGPLYKKFQMLELSENNITNANKVIELALQFVNTGTFRQYYGKYFKNTYLKLGAAYRIMGDDDNAINYFKKSGKVFQGKTIDEKCKEVLAEIDTERRIKEVAEKEMKLNSRIPLVSNKEEVQKESYNEFIQFYNRFLKLDLSENNITNAYEAFELASRFMKTIYFREHCTKSAKNSVCRKLIIVFQILSYNSVDVSVYLKQDGELNQDKIIESLYNKEIFDKYLETIEPAKMTSKELELLYNKFNELELSKNDVSKLIVIGSKFIDTSIFRNQYTKTLIDNACLKLGIAYYMVDNITTAVVYLNKTERVLKDGRFKQICNNVATAMNKKGAETIGDENILINFENEVEMLKKQQEKEDDQELERCLNISEKNNIIEVWNRPIEK